MKSGINEMGLVVLNEPASILNGRLKRLPARLCGLPMLGVVLAIFALVFGAPSAWATDPTYGDPTTLVTSAETLFASVSVFVVAVVGFWILVSIVKGVKRK